MEHRKNRNKKPNHADEWNDVKNAMTIAQAARIYEVSRSTIINDLNKGLIAFQSDGWVLLVSRRSLDRLYRKRQAKDS